MRVRGLREHDEFEAAHGYADEQLVEEGGQLSVVVHHRVETFAALARLALDTVARAVEGFFGPAPGLPLATHRELEANFSAFAEAKGLSPVPSSVHEQAECLSSELLADRDLHVRFAQGPRTLTASIWSASGDAGITPGSAEGLALRDLAELLESYVGDVLEYLEANSTS